MESVDVGSDMMKRNTIILLALFAAAPSMLLAAAESNRVSYVYYSNLWNHADLVIIGRATSTSATGERREMKDPHHTVTCEEVETIFRVRLVLKGTSQTEDIRLRHYRVPEGQKGFCFFGPKLAQFELPPKPTSASDFVALGPAIPEYLLFLRSTEDGHFVPVSGQENSDFSLREVYGLLNRPKRERPNQTNGH